MANNSKNQAETTKPETTTTSPAVPAYVPESFWGQLPTSPAEVPGFIAHRKAAYEATGQQPANLGSRIAELLNKANKAARQAGRPPVAGDGRAFTRYTVAGLLK
jgi:hypothetical protein